MIIIRQETIQDYQTTYNLVQEAFKSAEHSDGHEQDLVCALRKGTSFVPELSLVAEIDEQLVGYILFTKATVGPNTVLVLAPLAVLPAFQGQGIGEALITKGHQIAITLGYSHSLVLGSETYYPRFGYLPADQLGIEIPEGMPAANFMALPLLDNVPTLKGSVTYAKEFEL